LEIVDRYTSSEEIEKLKTLLSGESLLLLQKLTRQVPIANDIKKRAVELVVKTRNVPDLIEYGASPRASLAVIMAAKAKALIDGRKYVSLKDIEDMAFPVLRHRIVLSFKAEREGKNPDDVIRELLK
jgi:MoxR-like ATPase